MPASIPDLSISVCCRDDFIITFTTSRNESLRIRTNLTPAKLDEHRELLYKGLDRFWKLIGTELSVRDIKMASEAIQHLHAVGRQLNFQLFGASHRQEVEEFLRRACPTWQRSGSDGYRPPLVEIRS